ncbi:MAG: DoxX family protein [Solirubrobacterales bacterium]
MSTALAIASVLLAAALSYSAAMKLTHRPGVVASYARAGVPERWLDRLAALLFAASAALVAGILWEPLGLAAAAALVAYFAVAVSFHVRAGERASLPTPVAMLVLAAVTAALHVAVL